MKFSTFVYLAICASSAAALPLQQRSPLYAGAHVGGIDNGPNVPGLRPINPDSIATGPSVIDGPDAGTTLFGTPANRRGNHPHPHPHPHPEHPHPEHSHPHPHPHPHPHGHPHPEHPVVGTDDGIEGAVSRRGHPHPHPHPEHPHPHPHPEHPHPHPHREHPHPHPHPEHPHPHPHGHPHPEHPTVSKRDFQARLVALLNGQEAVSKREMHERLIARMVDNHNDAALHRRLFESLVPDLDESDSSAESGINKATSSEKRDTGISRRELRARIVGEMVANHDEKAFHRRLLSGLIPDQDDDNEDGSDSAAQSGDNKAASAADGSTAAESGDNKAGQSAVNRRLLGELIPDEDDDNDEGSDSAAQAGDDTKAASGSDGSASAEAGDNKATQSADSDLYKRLLLESLAHNDASLSRRLLGPLAQAAGGATGEDQADTASAEAAKKAKLDAKMQELDQKLADANFGSQ